MTLGEGRGRIISDALEAEFVPGEPPGVTELVYDSSGSHDECNQVVDEFAGLLWTEVPSQTLGFNADALFFMTDAGCLYYLPAFMRKVCRDFRGSDLIPQNLIAIFSPAGVLASRFTYLKDHLTASQKRVVRSFLEYVGDETMYYKAEVEGALASWP